jgi:hypothetical protein
VAVYTHRAVGQALAQLDHQRIHRAAEIPVYALSERFAPPAAAALQRRPRVLVSMHERRVYLDVDGTGVEAEIAEHRFS